MAVIDQTYIDRVNAALTSACPLATQNQDSVTAIKDKVLTFYREIGYPPSESQVVGWAVPFEQALLGKKAEEEAKARAKQERIDARRKEREYDKLPASAARAEAVAEVRKINEAKPASERFTPAKEYTQAEIDNMSDSDVKRLVFGLDVDENLNSSRPDDDLRKVQEKRLLSTKRSKDTPLKRALRRQIREGLL
jgi:hypothetical protein